MLSLLVLLLLGYWNTCYFTHDTYKVAASAGAASRMPLSTDTLAAGTAVDTVAA
jgi:hypothetical protein